MSDEREPQMTEVNDECAKLRERLREVRAKRDQYAEQLRRRDAALNERIKELSCLYDISRMLLQSDGVIDEAVLERVARRLPDGWRYPEKTRARVTVGQVVGQTPGFELTPWRLLRETTVGGVGVSAEVVLIEEPPESVDVIFLDEEERLLEAIVERVAEAAGRMHIEEQFRFQAMMLDAVGEAVIATDLDGRVTYWNQAAEQMYGWAADEAVGESIVDLTPTDENLETAGEIMAAVRAGEEWSGEFTVQRSNGETFPAQVTDAPLFDAAGEVIGIVGVSRDLSERKAIEERLLQSQKLEAVGRLAGGIAHDFNNMLAAIKGNAQLLLLDVEDPAVRTLAGEIEEASRRAATLVQQLLTFSRKGASGLQVLSVANTVDEMRSMFDRLVGDNVELSVSAASDLGSVRAGPGQIAQVVLNLVVNARDAMPDGGEIDIRLDNVEVAATSESVGAKQTGAPHILLSVSDTGHGMDEETASRIFEPFFTTKDVGRGTGLGLSTVHGIVKQSGGFIEVDTAPGEGTSFRVYLPRVDDEPQVVNSRAGEVGKVDKTAMPGGVVLVCDDEAAVRRLARRIIEREQMRVIEAESATEALQALEACDGQVDMLLSDVVMPGMTGPELVQEVHQRWPGITLLLMSGYAADDVLGRIDSEDGVVIMEKPFTPDELVEKIRSVLD